MTLKNVTYIQSLAVYGKGRYIGFKTEDSFNAFDRETKKIEEFKLNKESESNLICNKYYFVVANSEFYNVYSVNLNKVEKFENNL